MRSRAVLALLLVLAALAALLWGRSGLPRPPEERQEVRFEPVPLPREYRDRLVVWDYPWPHPHPRERLDWFDGLPAATHEQRLREALEAFRRRYPRIEVEYRMLDFASGPAEIAAAATGAGSGGAVADVVALWWLGPELPTGALVPVTPYVDETLRAAFHPLAWTLARRDGVEWAVPRWIAFHPWLARSGRVAASGETLTLDRAAAALGESAGDGPAFLTLGTAPFLLAEVLAGTGSAPGSGEAVAQRLAEALPLLRSAAGPRPGEATTEATVQWLARGGYVVAGGLGPGLLHWALTSAGNGGGTGEEGEEDETEDAPPAVVAPPRLDEDAIGGIPVSLGAYAVLRGRAPTREHAQAAIELAFHLAAWDQFETVARMLAVPAARATSMRWAEEAPLPAPLRQRLLAAAEDGESVPRVYTPAGALSPADRRHARLIEAWAAFWRGDDAALEDVVRLVAGSD